MYLIYLLLEKRIEMCKIVQFGGILTCTQKLHACKIGCTSVFACHNFIETEEVALRYRLFVRQDGNENEPEGESFLSFWIKRTNQSFGFRLGT